jgi:hypothetical protein
VAVSLSQSLTKMSNRRIFGSGEIGRYPYKIPVQIFKSFVINLLEPAGSVQICNGIAITLHLPLPYTSCKHRNLCVLFVFSKPENKTKKVAIETNNTCGTKEQNRYGTAKPSSIFSQCFAQCVYRI